MRTTYQNISMRFGFFAHALFVPKTPNVMGFSGSGNVTIKNPCFLDFGFCHVNGLQCSLISSFKDKHSDFNMIQVAHAG